MRSAYDAAQIRAGEQPLLDRLPEGTLMRRAASGLARRCAALLGRVSGARVVVLAGSGNNGGDALFAGAALARRGARVDALLTGSSAHEAGLAALRAAGGRIHPRPEDHGHLDTAGGVETAMVTSADLVLDGMLGIGGRGGLRDAAAQLADLLAGLPTAARPVVVAVDMPSGVDASTGEVAGTAVRADVTVTFGALKTGLVVAPGAQHAGTVETIDIGLQLPPAPVTLLDAADVASLLPAPHGETDKYRRGVVGVVAGSDAYPGAAVLAVGGAVVAGAGMVRYVGVAHPAELVRQRWPEAVVTVVDPGDGAAVLDAGRVQAWVIGSGLGTDDAAAAVVEAVLSTDLPVLADADAITVLSRQPDWLRRRRAPTLLTPHAGEFARLVDGDRDDVEARRLEHVRCAAADLGATVLLKGSTTLVASPEGQVRVNTAQTPYLATAGSGDVLSGICGALLATGLDPLDAGSAGAFLHGLAGLLAAGIPAAPFPALQIVDHVAAAVRAVRLGQ
ncbi:MAG TPA: NAD(P)H-hydrate dehydratase [Mycobacteriales bacterium]|nr:NAD(P)H-hydrate dehydratase [Mycobacteriales bacterium]